MKLCAILTALALFVAALALPECSEAARMGGGRSFGSRPSMTTPAQRPAMRQDTRQTPGTAAATRPGMFGGMGGLFGGLLAGTLLGSLLSGGGFAGGGFMDILLIGILAFIAWKLFSRMRSRQAQPAGGPAFDQPGPMTSQPFQRNDMGGTAWDKIRNLGGGATPAAASPNIDIPAGFDTQNFLAGAKAAYTRMQASWDKRDLADISNFATPTVMRELQSQAQADPGPSKTEIMLVNAELVGVEEEGANTRAQVYFDVLMREDPNAPAPENVREIWHFLRIGKDGNWKLDGIQQVN